MERRRIFMKFSMSRDSMNSLLGFVVLLTVAVTKNDALTCACSGSVCEDGGDTCRGDICFSQVSMSLEPGGSPTRRQGCYFQSQSQLCNVSSLWNTVLCCESERCNQDLLPNLPQPPVTTMAAPPSLSSGSCYQSDSSRGDEVRLCDLDTYCYSTLRRKTDGTVVHRRGCTDAPCINETRNRKIKRCCTHSLCNSLIQDPLAGEGGSVTPTSPFTRTQSPSSSQLVTPLATYSPPSLVPLTPTSSVSPTPPPTSESRITCHCDFGSCSPDGTCTTDFSCVTLYNYASGSTPENRELLSVSKFCLAPSSGGCGNVIGEGSVLMCCNHSYCNNFEVTTELPTSATTHPPTTRTTSKMEGETTRETKEESTSETTPTFPVPSANIDVYFIVGIGIFVVAGIILVIMVTVVICYCWCTRQTSSNRKRKKSSISSEIAVELAVGTSLSFPSPNIYTKRRDSSSVSTDATSSSRPISDEIPRTGYSSTSV